MVASLVNSSGRSSDAAYLFSTTTIWMALSNSALLFYDARYTTPLYGPLAAAAALGAERVIDRVQSRVP